MTLMIEISMIVIVALKMLQQSSGFFGGGFVEFTALKGSLL